MRRSTRRLLLAGASLPVLLVLVALAYAWGMEHLEGEQRSFWQSLEWAAETLTTTGYGGDHSWNHPVLVLFVSIIQFVGVFLVFLIFPIYLIPVLEERFEARLPRQAPANLEEHVVVFHYGPAVESLVERLHSSETRVVVVETDEGDARRALQRKVPVIYSPDEDTALEASRLRYAKALVANGRDEENVALILGARQMGFEGEIIALVEEPMHRKPLALAGASAVYTPRHILGAALAARASALISQRLAGVPRLGRLEVRELRVRAGSSLAGKTLAEANIAASTGATVIAQWRGGALEQVPSADVVLEPRSILVVVGSEESLDRLGELCGESALLAQQGPYLIAGFGEVGHKVQQLLDDAGEETWVIDRLPLPGVDQVGDVLEPEVLTRERVESAKAVIVALDTDELTLFTTVLVKDLSVNVPVIARVNQARNVEKIHRAGADFALSIAQVSGQMLARRLLGEELVSLDPQLELLKVAADGIAGRRPADLGIRERTGASVVAVERGDDVLVEIGGDFRFEEGDQVYVCGSAEAVRRYREVFG